jgi:ribonuclease P protein component
MLSSINRFHGHGSLKYTYRNGKAIRFKDFNFKYVENKRRDNSRFSIVVSKKISKKATIRNLIRRRIYEIIRLELPYLRSNYDIVIIINSPTLATISHVELLESVKNGLKKANLYINR